MNSISIYHKKFHLWFLLSFLIFVNVGFFVMPSFEGLDLSGDEIYTVSLNGTEVGTVGSKDMAKSCLNEARREIAGDSEDLVYLDAELSLEGKKILWGQVDPEERVTRNMKEVLEGSRSESLVHCYTVKIGEDLITLSSGEEVKEMLQNVLAQYDEDGIFIVNLVLDTDHYFGGLTANVKTTKEQETEEIKSNRLPIAGINEELDDVLLSAEPAVPVSFDDYPLGITTMSFGKRIEIAESYLPESQIMDLATAQATVLQSDATKKVVEVKSGDTLSQIAEDYGLTMDELLAMNPNYESEDAVIRVGDLITVTVPKALLPVDYTQKEYYEEDYYADTVYVDNDSWYTTKQLVIQEPTSGHRRVIAEVSYEDTNKLGSDILKQQVLTVAIPRIIERGTLAPPTYIWPVSGGYVSSGFGGRSAPKAGASTYHKGIDIACSTGTAVMASTGGTVSMAGWQSGYGYVVYINHGNGIETRYGHLSKILVHVGETVSQGERIALSGNTGNSTGPHCHFEIRMDGTAVNPLSYLN